jgi:hypothetical protein
MGQAEEGEQRASRGRAEGEQRVSRGRAEGGQMAIRGRAEGKPHLLVRRSHRAIESQLANPAELNENVCIYRGLVMDTTGIMCWSGVDVLTVDITQRPGGCIAGGGCAWWRRRWSQP